MNDPTAATEDVTPPPALTEVGRLRAQVEQLTEDVKRSEELAKLGARCFRDHHDGQIAEGRAVIEGHRFALSVALGLGTGAPWDAIHERVKELAAEPAASAVVSPPTDRAALRDRIAEALYERERPPRDPHWPDAYAMDRETFEAMADAVLSVLPEPTDRAAEVCICGHTEAQHFEDVCITEITGCNCGDFLVPEAAREVIARWREAAMRAQSQLRRLAVEAHGTGTQQQGSEALPSINAGDVQGFCPACRHSTLYVGAGGHLTCSLMDCPKPEAADELLHAPAPVAQQPATEAHLHETARGFDPNCDDCAHELKRDYDTEQQAAAERDADRIVAYVLAYPLTGRAALHCLRCAPTPPLGDIWTPVTSEELEDGGFCVRCGTDVLIPQQPAAAHSCSNCEGVDPTSCLMNPDRPKKPPMDPVHILGIDADDTPAEQQAAAADDETPQPTPVGPAPTALRIRVLREVLARIDGSVGDGDSATEDVPAVQVRAVFAEILADMQPRP